MKNFALRCLAACLVAVLLAIAVPVLGSDKPTTKVGPLPQHTKVRVPTCVESPGGSHVARSLRQWWSPFDDQRKA